MGKRAILVIDRHSFWDELRAGLHKALRIELILEDKVPQAKELLKQEFFLAVFLSEFIPDSQTDSLMVAIKQEYPFLPVFIISSRPTVEGAVAAMREGAQDYLALPLSFEQLKELVAPFACSHGENGPSLKNKGSENGRIRPIVSQDPVVLHIMRMAQAVAPAKATVLIQGESGTGKEILARYLHAQSDRASGPFIAVNCAALPEGLLESELFGHEKGAFTGAIMRKLGKFELAHNGTLLLDEISEMHPHLQAKLLRVVQENEIDRIGGRHAIPINVRVIATTNQNLLDRIQKGEFREDLYYRLQVISLQLPPLRSRRGDVSLLAQYFLKRFSQLFEKGNVQFTQAALSALDSAPWPGNIRQLENAIARGVLLAQGNYIHPRDLFGVLPHEGAASTEVAFEPDKPVTLKEMEQRMIFQALNETSGNRTHAAKLLGISVRTLRNKLHEYRHQALAQGCRSQVA